MSADFPDFELDQELNELRTVCDQIRSKILMYNPPQLIGGLWSTLLVALMSKFDDEGDGSLPNVSADEKGVLFAMEYLHATYAAEGLPDAAAAPVDGSVIAELLELSEKAIAHVFHFGFASMAQQFGDDDVNFHQLQSTILTNWVLIRGRRYQVMEEEFFKYVLEPHSDMIKELYGISSNDLAREIQAAVSSAREGIDRARDEISMLMEKTSDQAQAAGLDMKSFMADDSSLTTEDRKRATSAFEDMMFGGVFNVSKHTKIPKTLLEDLSFEPGAEDQFLDGTEYAGTPLQTLPARIKPLIKLDQGYYCTEPNFIRDSFYRSLQGAMIKRKPEYREGWNRRQKEMSEAAFADLMGDSLKTATVLSDVYYPIGKKQWAETDGVILIDDVMICLEAKAGSESYAAPSSNMHTHTNTIEELVIKAYKQAKRFIEYVYASDNAPLYAKRDDGKYVEVARVRRADLRKVYPIGLTVEAFTPYSAAVKERDDVVAIVDQHNFISMSLDDLFVLRQLLNGAGEFLHYLDVRQALAGMKNVSLFDEMDHIGAYISNNRIDQGIAQMAQDEGADYVGIDGMQQDILDPYFSHPDWPDCERPRQIFPARTQELLDALADTSQAGWLSGDTFIRDMSGEGRQQIADQYEKILPNLAHKSFTYFAVGGEITAIFGMLREDADSSLTNLTRTSETMAMALEQKNIRLFEISVNPDGKISKAKSRFISSPTVLRNDYSQLFNEAKILRAKMVML
ncbi:hypothetical protein [Ascidiaceihabitans sp.]|uniref:hypothetical protein n=1 Tax=Ascidiaceihabitans sp. TaxID=1872644 RepID=UPI00329854B3